MFDNLLKAIFNKTVNENKIVNKNNSNTKIKTVNENNSNTKTNSESDNMIIIVIIKVIITIKKTGITIR